MTEEERNRLRAYDEKAALAKSLASRGVASIRLCQASFVFWLFSFPGICGVFELPGRQFETVWIIVMICSLIPPLFLFPIYLMRTKERNIAHAGAKRINDELRTLVGDIDSIRCKTYPTTGGMATAGHQPRDPLSLRNPFVTIPAVVIVAAALFTFISGKKNGNKTGYGVQPSRDSSSTGVRDPRETLDIFLKSRFPRAQNITVYQNGQVGDSHFYWVDVYPGSGRAAEDRYEAVVKGGSVTGFSKQ